MEHFGEKKNRLPLVEENINVTAQQDDKEHMTSSLFPGSRDTVVGIVTRLRAGWSSNCESISGRAKRLSLVKASIPALVPTQTPI